MPPKLDSELKTLRRHEEYYIPGADLCILVEHVHFRVHRYFFERESNWFKRKLLIPASPGAKPQGSDDSSAIILPDLTPKEFAKFLWVFYNPKYSIYEAEVDDWSIILTLSHRWAFPEVKALAVRELETKPMLDVKRIKLYHETDVDRNLLVPRYAALIERDEPLTLEEGMDLGMETTLQIAKGREEARASRLPSGVRSPLTPTLRGADLHEVVRELFKILPTTEDQDKEDETQPVNGFHNSGALEKTKAPTVPTQLPSPPRQPTPPPVPPKPTPAVKIQEKKTTTQPPTVTPTTPKTPATVKGNKAKGTKNQKQPQTPQTPKTAQQQSHPPPSTPKEPPPASSALETTTDQIPPPPPPVEAKEETETITKEEEAGEAQAPSQPQPRVDPEAGAAAAVAGQQGQEGESSAVQNGAGAVSGTGAGDDEVKTEAAVEAEPKSAGEKQVQTPVEPPADASKTPVDGQTKEASSSATAETAPALAILPLPGSAPYSPIVLDQLDSVFGQQPLSPAQQNSVFDSSSFDWEFNI